MIIIYMSIALFVGSLVFLAYQVIKTYHDTKPTLKELSDTAVRLQSKMNLMKQEANNLAITQQNISQDVQYKKESVQYTIDSVKAAPESFKEIWNTIKGVKTQV